LGRIDDLNHLHSIVSLFSGVFIILLLVPLALKEPNRMSMAKITNLLPTSGILILLGAFCRLVNHFSEEYLKNKYSPFIITADGFQHLLISPILLYSSYKLYHDEFFRQWKSIIVLGIVGTFLNIILSAAMLYFINASGWLTSMNMFITTVIASCISVGEPSAVAAAFNYRKEVKNHPSNFYLPYGVALLGYGVAMELFKFAQILAWLDGEEHMTLDSYLFIIFSKFTDPFFGVLVGVSCGLVSAAITKITTQKSQYFEPVVTLSCAAIGYLLCLDLGFSYIFGTIACGLVQQRYTLMNMSAKSCMNTENILFAISLVCELFMYVLVGYLAINVSFYDTFGFAALAIVVIYIIKILVNVGLSFVLNIFLLSPISFKCQLLIFGTPRGPMSLAMAWAAIRVPYHMLIKETVLLVIVFSQLIDGVMSRYLASQFSTDANNSVVNNLLVLSSTYGGAELGNILGLDMTANKNNLFRMFERHMSRFFISDKARLSNSYRIRAKEEQRQFFLKLEKHNYLKEYENKESELGMKLSKHVVTV